MKNYQGKLYDSEFHREKRIPAYKTYEEIRRFQSAFVQNISHEIRTPLNAIVGFSALISEKDQTDEAREYYSEIIMRSSDNLLAIINDIVEVANIEAGNLKLKKSEINLNFLLNKTYQKFYSDAADKGLGLRFEKSLSDKDSFLHTDGAKVAQILSNLISNAIKFTSQGQVVFGCNLKNGFLEFYVADTGIGITEDQHSRIFESFYKVKESREQSCKGTGLGLTIAKAYVELIGGKIWLKSEPGKGTEVFFTIPHSKEKSS